MPLGWNSWIIRVTCNSRSFFVLKQHFHSLQVLRLAYFPIKRWNVGLRNHHVVVFQCLSNLPIFAKFGVNIGHLSATQLSFFYHFLQSVMTSRLGRKLMRWQQHWHHFVHGYEILCRDSSTGNTLRCCRTEIRMAGIPTVYLASIVIVVTVETWQLGIRNVACSQIRNVPTSCVKSIICKSTILQYG
jgi:hypothetical protein